MVIEIILDVQLCSKESYLIEYSSCSRFCVIAANSWNVRYGYPTPGEGRIEKLNITPQKTPPVIRINFDSSLFR